ncbi:MAG: hypothetical protein ACXABY_26230 [Candidatus Thorarchaeota archaeon]
MAKYADYMQNDSLEGEIEEAAQATAEREPELPTQFQGKSAADIARSYQELKEMTDRQANELGTLRTTTSLLTDRLQNSSQQSEKSHTERTPITVDDLYEDPEAAIDRRVDERVLGKLEALDQKFQALESKTRLDEMEGNFPGFRETAKTPEMRNWIGESGYRQRLAQAADGGDLQAAEDILGMYYDLKGIKQDKVKDSTRKRQLQDASLESGTSDVHSPVQKYSRSKLELARRQAKRGNMEAQQYLKENGDDIYRAYEEGRIVN